MGVVARMNRGKGVDGAELGGRWGAAMAEVCWQWPDDE